MTPVYFPSIRQLKAARALLAWSQSQLAGAADISIPTVKRLEAQEGLLGGRNETGNKIRGALEAAGVEFIRRMAVWSGCAIEETSSEKVLKGQISTCRHAVVKPA